MSRQRGDHDAQTTRIVVPVARSRGRERAAREPGQVERSLSGDGSGAQRDGQRDRKRGAPEPRASERLATLPNVGIVIRDAPLDARSSYFTRASVAQQVADPLLQRNRRRHGARIASSGG